MLGRIRVIMTAGAAAWGKPASQISHFPSSKRWEKNTLVVYGTRSSLYRDAAMYFVLSTNVTDGERISLAHMPLMPP